MVTKYTHIKDPIIGYVVTEVKTTEGRKGGICFHAVTDSSYLPVAKGDILISDDETADIGYELGKYENFVGILPALPGSYVHSVLIEKPFIGEVMTLGREFKGATNLDWDKFCKSAVEDAVENYKAEAKKKK
ncbi:MAG: hypothetical protein QCH31_09530 [Methanolobus sp.]|nr:hypothetical protein [Methanolobus sp.]